MKTRLFCMLVGAVTALFLSGCVVPTDMDKLMPNGHAAKASGVITGKFSNTNIEAENFSKTVEKVTADRIHFKHSNIWLPNAEFTFEGYERLREVSEKQP